MRPRLQSVLALLKRDEGASAVEMAISCTVLFAMLLGICQISFALYIYQFTSDAARQASRYAMVRGSTSCANTPNLSNCNASAAQIQTYTQGLNYPGIRSSNLWVSTSWCAASGSTPTNWSGCSHFTPNSPGNLVRVHVSYPLSLAIPFSSRLSLRIGSTSNMVISQ